MITLIQQSPCIHPSIHPSIYPVVVIADTKQSHVEILQIAGRACRTSKDKPCGYVLIPVQGTFEGGGNRSGGGVEELHEGGFGTVVNVLQTFTEQVRERFWGGEGWEGLGGLEIAFHKFVCTRVCMWGCMCA